MDQPVQRVHQDECGKVGVRCHELVTMRDQHVSQQLLDLLVRLVVTVVVGQPELLALLERLGDIEARVEHVTVPLSYANELYSLRSHIQMVRARVLAAPQVAVAA